MKASYHLVWWFTGSCQLCVLACDELVILRIMMHVNNLLLCSIVRLLQGAMATRPSTMPESALIKCAHTQYTHCNSNQTI